MPLDDRFAQWRSIIGLVIPPLDNPARRLDQLQDNLRHTVYGQEYETVTPHEVESLLQTQGEIATWLAEEAETKRLIKTLRYTPHTPEEVKEKQGEHVDMDLTIHTGSYTPGTHTESSPYRYHLQTANNWPEDISDKLGNISQYYDSFYFLQKAKSESLRFAIHPDNTYDLVIRFSGEASSDRKNQLSTYKPPTLPLAEMPKQEFLLVQSQLQNFNKVKRGLKPTFA
jgi:hypothetical protein